MKPCNERNLRRIEKHKRCRFGGCLKAIDLCLDLRLVLETGMFIPHCKIFQYFAQFGSREIEQLLGDDQISFRLKQSFGFQKTESLSIFVAMDYKVHFLPAISLGISTSSTIKSLSQKPTPTPPP